MTEDEITFLLLAGKLLGAAVCLLFVQRTAFGVKAWGTRTSCRQRRDSLASIALLLPRPIDTNTHTHTHTHTMLPSITMELVLHVGKTASHVF